MPTHRRRFLKNSALAAGFFGLARCTKAAPSLRVFSPYGPLQNDRHKILDLPRDFSYTVLSRTGDIMDDGFKVPGMPDDMATFAGDDGRVVLVCNHELTYDQTRIGPFNTNRFPDGLDHSLSHDPGGQTQAPYIGGTTTLVYNPQTRRTEKHVLSLTGTDRNCSGGATPWGSWISCEEPSDLTSSRGRKHGYCFEVKADPELGLQRAVALEGLGRFRHEGVAYDPIDGSLYVTEDRNDGLLYRFIPDRKEDFTRGKLYALALKGQGSTDLRNYDPNGPQILEGKPLPVQWIEMKGIDAPRDDLRYRGFKAGAARFARGEGIYYSDGAHYLCCTDGGPERLGQIYRILPRHFGNADPAVELFLQSTDNDLLANGDNLCAAPNGDLIICEDLVPPHNRRRTPHLRGITPQGKIFTIARNARDRTEFAGSCFSPDGTVLFVNLQGLGLTLAITGPWRA